MSPFLLARINPIYRLELPEVRDSIVEIYARIIVVTSVADAVVHSQCPKAPKSGSHYERVRGQ